MAVISIPTQKVDAWGTELLEILIYVPGKGVGIDHSEQSGVEELRIAMFSKPPNSFNDPRVGGLATVPYAVSIVHNAWPVDAHGKAGPILGAGIEYRLGDQHSICLDANRIGRRQRTTEDFK